MNVLSWLTSLVSNRSKSLSIYKRGLARAKNHDLQGAIDDYTSTIGMPDTSADVKAMALFNRALVHVAAGNDQQGTDDLDAVLKMGRAPENVKLMAKQKLYRMESRSRKKSEMQHAQSTSSADSSRTDTSNS